jgi:hypothetical protein
MKKFLLNRNLIGLLIFCFIIELFLLAQVAHKIPYIKENLPYRFIVHAKQSIKVYDCSDLSRPVQISTLEAGETADYKGVVCGSHTHHLINLSDGRTGCYFVNDEENAEQKTLNFYYF